MSETLIGICVQTVLFLLGGYAMVIRADVSYRNLKEEVHEMKEELKTLAVVITTQAVQTTRLDSLTTMLVSMEKRIEDLRRGAGYVKERRALDGEYDG